MQRIVIFGSAGACPSMPPPVGVIGRRNRPSSGSAQHQHRLAGRRPPARRSAGDTAADHDQIDMGIGLFITVRVGGRRLANRPSRIDRLGHTFPVPRGWMKVLEARRKKAGEPVVHRTDIGRQAGPSSSAQGHQAPGDKASWWRAAPAQNRPPEPNPSRAFGSSAPLAIRPRGR